ncbi:MAG: glycosyltransferase family 4 protein [Candidatus Binatia bacterium]|nr:glycosyltransferase family 4 protein [Candidatus Binatia bacterium]
MVADHIRRHYPARPERIRVIYNGVNLERFRPEMRVEFRQATRSAWETEEKEMVILFVSNNFRLKGLHCLIQALGKLKQVRGKVRYRLWVIGRGRRETYLKLAARLGCAEEIVFMGPQSHIEAYYAAADLLVHPTFYDPSANVCLEAMAGGLPTITTRYNGVSEIMEDNGLGEWIIDDPYDTDLLAGRIRRLCEEDVRQEVAQRSRSAVGALSLEENCRRVLEVYRQVIAEREK